jgi:hypothetical protein
MDDLVKRDTFAETGATDDLVEYENRADDKRVAEEEDLGRFSVEALPSSSCISTSASGSGAEGFGDETGDAGIDFEVEGNVEFGKIEVGARDEDEDKAEDEDDNSVDDVVVEDGGIISSRSIPTPASFAEDIADNVEGRVDTNSDSDADGDIVDEDPEADEDEYKDEEEDVDDDEEENKDEGKDVDVVVEDGGIISSRSIPTPASFAEDIADNVEGRVDEDPDSVEDGDIVDEDPDADEDEYKDEEEDVDVDEEENKDEGKVADEERVEDKVADEEEDKFEEEDVDVDVDEEEQTGGCNNK